MRRKISFGTCLTALAASSAAWAAPAQGGAGNGKSLFLAGVLSESEGFLSRIAHTITEPVGLLLMGVGLIALSIVVRKRAFGRRSR